MLYGEGGGESVARILTSTSGDDSARGEGLLGRRRLIMEGARQQGVQNTSTASTVSSADTGPFIVTRGPMLNALLSGNARATGQSRAQAIAAAAQSHLAVYSNPAIRQILERRHQPSQPLRRPVVKKRARSEGPAREPSTEAPAARANTQADLDAAELVGMEMEGDEMEAFAAAEAEGGGGGAGYGVVDATPKDEQGNGTEPHRPVVKRKRPRRPPTSTAPAVTRTMARRRQQEEENRRQAEAVERARKRMKAVPHSRPPRPLSPDAQRARDEMRARRAYDELERRSKEKQGLSKEERDKRERLLALQEKIRRQTAALRAVKQSKSLRRLEREAEKLLRAQGIDVAAGNDSAAAGENVVEGVEPQEESVGKGEDEDGEEATEPQQQEEHKEEHHSGAVLSQPQKAEKDSQGYTPPGSDSPGSSEPADELVPPQIPPPNPHTSPPPKPPSARPASSPQRTARPVSSRQRSRAGPSAPPSRSPVKTSLPRPSTSPHKAKSPSQPRGGGRVVSVRPAQPRPSPTRPVAPSTVPAAAAAAAEDDFSWLDDVPSSGAPPAGGGGAHGATGVAHVGLGGASTRRTAVRSGEDIRGDNRVNSPTAGTRPRPAAGLHARSTQRPLVSGAAADGVADAHSTAANKTSSDRAHVRFASPEKRPLSRTSPIKQRTELVLREKLPAAQELLEGTNRADAKKRREEGRQYMQERKRKEAEQRRREEEEKREAQERIRKTLADIERVRANERTALVVHMPAATRQPRRPPWVGVLGPDADEDALLPPSPPRPPIKRKRVRDACLALEGDMNGAAFESDAVPVEILHRLERRMAASVPPFEMSAAVSSIAPAGETHEVEVEVEPARVALQAHVEPQAESTGMASSGEVDFRPAEHDRYPHIAPHPTTVHAASGHGGATADLDATVPLPPPTVPQGAAAAGKKTTTKRRSTITTTTTSTTKRKKSSSTVKPRVANRSTTATRTRPVSARGGRVSRPARGSEPASLDFAEGQAMVLNLLEKLTHVQQRVERLRAEVLGDTSASGGHETAEQQPPRTVNDSITGQARRRPHTATEVWAETREAIAAAMSRSQEGIPPSSAGYRSSGDDAELPRSQPDFPPSADGRSGDGGSGLSPSVSGRPTHDDTGSREEELLVDYDPLSPPPGQAGRLPRRVAAEVAAAGSVGEERGWLSGFPHTDADEAFMVEDGGMAVSPRDADVSFGAGEPQLEHDDLDAELSPLPAVELAAASRDEHEDMQRAGEEANAGFTSQEPLRLPRVQGPPAHQSGESGDPNYLRDDGHGGGVVDREEGQYDDEYTRRGHATALPPSQSEPPLGERPARGRLDNLGNELKWTAVAQQRRMAEDVAEQFSQKRGDVAVDSRTRSVKQQHQQQQGKAEEEKGIPAVDIATALFGRRTPLPRAEDSEGAESESTDSMSVVHVFAKELLRQKVMQERKSEREKQKKQQQQPAPTAAHAVEAPQQRQQGEVTPLPSPKSLQDAAGGGLIQDPAAVRAYWDRYLSRPAPGGRPDEVRKLERADSSSYSDEGFEDEDPGDRRHQHPSVDNVQGRFEEGAPLPSPIMPAPLHGDSHEESSMDERLAPVALHQALLNELQLHDGLWNAELQLEAMARQRATTEAEVTVQRAMNVMAAQQSEQQWGEALRRREEEHARQMADAVSLMRQQADHMAGMEMAQTIGLGQQLVDALQREAHAIESAHASAAQQQRPPQPLYTSPHIQTLPPERQQQLRMQPATSADHASNLDHESQGYQTDVSYAQSFASPTSPATEVSTAPPSDVEEVEEEDEEEDEQAYSEGFESVDEDVRSSRETSYVSRRSGPGRISEIMDDDGGAEVGDEEHEVVSESDVMEGLELAGFGVIERRMPSRGSTPASLPSASAAASVTHSQVPSRPSTSASLPGLSPKPPSVVGVESGLQGLYEGNKADGYTAALIRGLREELEARSSRLLGSLTAKEKLAEEQRDHGLADLAKCLSTQGPEALLTIQAQIAEVGRVYCEAVAQVEADRKTVRAKREKELRRLAKMESEMRRYEDSLRAGMETSQTSTTSADDMVGEEPARPKRRARFARPQHGGLLRREVLGSKARLPIPGFTRSASEASAGSSGVEEEGDEEEEEQYYTDDFDANASSRAASVMSDGEDAALPAAKESAAASVGGSEQWTEGAEEEEPPRVPSTQPSQAAATPASSFISSTAPEEEREEASAFEEGEFDEHEEEDEGEETIRVGPPAPTSVMSRSARSYASEIPSDADRSMVSEASASAVSRSVASEMSGGALSAPVSSVGYSATFEEDEEGHVRVVQSGGGVAEEAEEFEDFEEEEGDEESRHPETPRGTSPVAAHRSATAASPGKSDGILARRSPSVTDAHLGHVSPAAHSVSRYTATPAEPPSPASSTASNALSLESLEELSRLRASEAELGVRRVKLERLKEEAAMLLRFKREEQALAAEVRALARQAMAADVGGAGGGESVQEGGLRREAEWRGWSADELDEVQSIVRASIAEYEQKRAARKAAQGPVENIEVLPVPSSPMSQLGDLSFASDGDLKGIKETQEPSKKVPDLRSWLGLDSSSATGEDDDEEEDEDGRHDEHSTPIDSFASESGLDSVEQEEAIRRRFRLSVQGDVEPTREAMENAAVVIQRQVRRHQAACIMERSRRSPVRIREKRIHRQPSPSSSDSSLDVLSSGATRATRAQSQRDRMSVRQEVGSEVSSLGAATARQGMQLELGHDEPHARLGQSERMEEPAGEDSIQSRDLGRPHARGAEPAVGEYGEEEEEEDGESKGGSEEEERTAEDEYGDDFADDEDEGRIVHLGASGPAADRPSEPPPRTTTQTEGADEGDVGDVDEEISFEAPGHSGEDDGSDHWLGLRQREQPPPRASPPPHDQPEHSNEEEGHDVLPSAGRLSSIEARLLSPADVGRGTVASAPPIPQPAGEQSRASPWEHGEDEGSVGRALPTADTRMDTRDTPSNQEPSATPVAAQEHQPSRGFETQLQKPPTPSPTPQTGAVSAPPMSPAHPLEASGGEEEEVEEEFDMEVYQDDEEQEEEVLGGGGLSSLTRMQPPAQAEAAVDHADSREQEDEQRDQHGDDDDANFVIIEGPTHEDSDDEDRLDGRPTLAELAQPEAHPAAAVQGASVHEADSPLQDDHIDHEAEHVSPPSTTSALPPEGPICQSDQGPAIEQSIPASHVAAAPHIDEHSRQAEQARKAAVVERVTQMILSDLLDEARRDVASVVGTRLQRHDTNAAVAPLPPPPPHQCLPPTPFEERAPPTPPQSPTSRTISPTSSEEQGSSPTPFVDNEQVLETVYEEPEVDDTSAGPEAGSTEGVKDAGPAAAATAGSLAREDEEDMYTFDNTLPPSPPVAVSHTAQPPPPPRSAEPSDTEPVDWTERTQQYIGELFECMDYDAVEFKTHDRGIPRDILPLEMFLDMETRRQERMSPEDIAARRQELEIETIHRKAMFDGVHDVFRRRAKRMEPPMPWTRRRPLRNLTGARRPSRQEMMEEVIRVMCRGGWGDATDDDEPAQWVDCETEEARLKAEIADAILQDLLLDTAAAVAWAVP